MPKLVTAGAMMKCSFGLAPSALVVTPENKTLVMTPAATIMDNIPMKNVPPFGMCNTVSNPTVAAATSAALGVLTPQACVRSFPLLGRPVRRQPPQRRQLLRRIARPRPALIFPRLHLQDPVHLFRLNPVPPPRGESEADVAWLPRYQTVGAFRPGDGGVAATARPCGVTATPVRLHGFGLDQAEWLMADESLAGGICPELFLVVTARQVYSLNDQRCANSEESRYESKPKVTI